MFEKFIALVERGVIALENLVSLASGQGSQQAAPPAPAEPEKKPRASRKSTEASANAAAAGAAASSGASEPAPSVSATTTEKKVESVSKDQVRALLQQYGDLDSIAAALEIAKKFATENTDPKGRTYTGESIGTIDPIKYGEVAAALSKAIAEKIAAAKPAETSPLDD